MPVIVLGCGRSGTNMLLSLMRGSSCLQATKLIEDKRFAGRKRLYPLSYLSKCDTTYCSPRRLRATLGRNPEMRVLWAIRNPKDICLSKIRRGQPAENGGDCAAGVLSPDSTAAGCIQSLEKMFELYKGVATEFGERVLVVKMEDVILTTEEEARRICIFLSIPFEAAMLDFAARIRHKQKLRRYGAKIDKSQVDLWEQWDEVYDGFFKDSSIDIEGLFTAVEHITSYFGY